MKSPKKHNLAQLQGDTRTWSISCSPPEVTWSEAGGRTCGRLSFRFLMQVIWKHLHEEDAQPTLKPRLSILTTLHDGKLLLTSHVFSPLFSRLRDNVSIATVKDLGPFLELAFSSIKQWNNGAYWLHVSSRPPASFSHSLNKERSHWLFTSE